MLVGGTNGKGSTSALIASMARAAGYRVGTFASPHLESLRERIGIDGRAIDDETLADCLERILAPAATARAEPPTFFEAMTLSAFLHYRDAEADLAVMEVGLGGRLDATNVGEPLVSAVVSIGFDHQKQLGNTLAAIAGEKAAIARPARPLVTWAETDEVRGAFTHHAARLGARLVRVDATTRLLDTSNRSSDDAWATRQRFHLETPRAAYDLEIAMPGAHQRRNAAVATAVAEELALSGFEAIDREAIERGAAACYWPGRLEWVELPDGRRLLLDVGHNAAGAAAVADYVARGTAGDERTVDLLFGAVGDKAIEKMLPTLAARAQRVTLTRPESSRAGDPHDWLPMLEPGTDVRVVVDPSDALEQALAQLEPRRALVVTGSIFLVGALRRRLRERFGVPAATT